MENSHRIRTRTRTVTPRVPSSPPPPPPIHNARAAGTYYTPATYYLRPTTCYCTRTYYLIVPILPATYDLLSLPTTYCLLPTTYYCTYTVRVDTCYSTVPTTHNLPTTYYLLPIVL